MGERCLPLHGVGVLSVGACHKEVCYVGQDDKRRRKIAQGADYGFAGGFYG